MAVATRSPGCGVSTAGTRSVGAARASGRRTIPAIAPWWTSAHAYSPGCSSGPGACRSAADACSTSAAGTARCWPGSFAGAPCPLASSASTSGPMPSRAHMLAGPSSPSTSPTPRPSPTATPASISRSASRCSPRSSTTGSHGRWLARCGACSDRAARSCGTTSASATRGTRTCGGCRDGPSAGCFPGGLEASGWSRCCRRSPAAFIAHAGALSRARRPPAAADALGGAAGAPAMNAEQQPFVSVVVPARTRSDPSTAASPRSRHSAGPATGWRSSWWRTARATARAQSPRRGRRATPVSTCRLQAANHAEAMNAGIRAARGEIVARVDAHSYSIEATSPRSWRRSTASRGGRRGRGVPARR